MFCTHDPQHPQDGTTGTCKAGGAHLESSDEVLVTVTRSAGDDRATVVYIDTNIPNAAFRVLLNDGEIFTGVPYKHTEDGLMHDAESKQFSVTLDQIPYTGLEVD